ncbi:helicase SNF2, partial [Dietzia sp. Cai40]|nr:helicase SNF2 [Dietzia sp. Cai40]
MLGRGGDRVNGAAQLARRDVVGRPYSGCVRSSVRVPESEVERFVGTAALARARPYVNPDAIGDVSYNPGSRTLSALVTGSGGRRYRTEVAFGHPDASGWSRPKLSTCTCPVAMRCKHAAALMLFAGVDPDGGAHSGVGGGEPVPEWRRRVEEMMHGTAQQARPRESEVYGLQLSVVADETVDDGWTGGLRPGLGNRLRARIVVPGRGGRWKSAGVEWDRLRYGWTADMSAA